MSGSSGNDNALLLPAASVAVALRACAPPDSAEVVTLQSPVVLVVVVPTNAVPSNTCTLLFASAVPVNCTWFPLTIESPVSTGAFGATVSIFTASAAEAAPVPDVLVAVAVRLWLPSAREAVVKFHAPLLLAVAVPTCAVPSNTFTVLFAAAVPVRVRVLSLVIPSPATPLSLENDAMTGALGGAGAATVSGNA